MMVQRLDVPDYSGLQAHVDVVRPDPADSDRWNDVVDFLIGMWTDRYAASVPDCELVRVLDSGSYLFDCNAERLVAAWAVSRGDPVGTRDKRRMAGHPLGAGSDYHRGHAIPHSMGGPMDINLVPQLAHVNVGPFRTLERKAVALPGSLYFTCWNYAHEDRTGQYLSQKAIAVEQGLLVAGQPVEIELFVN
jgi:hypothetical protein